jgi:CRP-like cAMP-binding protein
MAMPRTASIRAKSLCDLFVLSKKDFTRILRDHPQFAEEIRAIAEQRYALTLQLDSLMR